MYNTYIAYYASAVIDFVPVRVTRMLSDDVTPSFPIIGIIAVFCHCRYNGIVFLFTETFLCVQEQLAIPSALIGFISL